MEFAGYAPFDAEWAVFSLREAGVKVKKLYDYDKVTKVVSVTEEHIKLLLRLLSVRYSIVRNQRIAYMTYWDGTISAIGMCKQFFYILGELFKDVKPIKLRKKLNELYYSKMNELPTDRLFYLIGKNIGVYGSKPDRISNILFTKITRDEQFSNDF